MAANLFLEKALKISKEKGRRNFEAIIQKYDKEFVDSPLINLHNLEVTSNKEKIRKLKRRSVGTCSLAIDRAIDISIIRVSPNGKRRGSKQGAAERIRDATSCDLDASYTVSLDGVNYGVFNEENGSDVESISSSDEDTQEEETLSEGDGEEEDTEESLTSAHVSDVSADESSDRDFEDDISCASHANYTSRRLSGGKTFDEHTTDVPANSEEQPQKSESVTSDPHDSEAAVAESDFDRETTLSYPFDTEERSVAHHSPLPADNLEDPVELEQHSEKIVTSRGGRAVIFETLNKFPREVTNNSGEPGAPCRTSPPKVRRLLNETYTVGEDPHPARSPHKRPESPVSSDTDCDATFVAPSVRPAKNTGKAVPSSVPVSASPQPRRCSLQTLRSFQANMGENVRKPNCKSNLFMLLEHIKASCPARYIPDSGSEGDDTAVMSAKVRDSSPVAAAAVNPGGSNVLNKLPKALTVMSSQSVIPKVSKKDSDRIFLHAKRRTPVKAAVSSKIRDVAKAKEPEIVSGTQSTIVTENFKFGLYAKSTLNEPSMEDADSGMGTMTETSSTESSESTTNSKVLLKMHQPKRAESNRHRPYPTPAARKQTITPSNKVGSNVLREKQALTPQNNRRMSKILTPCSSIARLTINSAKKTKELNAETADVRAPSRQSPMYFTPPPPPHSSSHLKPKPVTLPSRRSARCSTPVKGGMDALNISTISNIPDLEPSTVPYQQKIVAPPKVAASHSGSDEDDDFTVGDDDVTLKSSKSFTSPQPVLLNRERFRQPPIFYSGNKASVLTSAPARLKGSHRLVVQSDRGEKRTRILPIPVNPSPDPSKPKDSPAASNITSLQSRVSCGPLLKPNSSKDLMARRSIIEDFTRSEEMASKGLDDGAPKPFDFSERLKVPRASRSPSVESQRSSTKRSLIKQWSNTTSSPRQKTPVASPSLPARLLRSTSKTKDTFSSKYRKGKQDDPYLLSSDSDSSDCFERYVKSTEKSRKGKKSSPRSRGKTGVRQKQTPFHTEPVARSVPARGCDLEKMNKLQGMNGLVACGLYVASPVSSSISSAKPSPKSKSHTRRPSFGDRNLLGKSPASFNESYLWKSPTLKINKVVPSVPDNDGEFSNDGFQDPMETAPQSGVSLMETTSSFCLGPGLCTKTFCFSCTIDEHA